MCTGAHIHRAGHRAAGLLPLTFFSQTLVHIWRLLSHRTLSLPVGASSALVPAHCLPLHMPLLAKAPPSDTPAACCRLSSLLPALPPSRQPSHPSSPPHTLLMYYPENTSCPQRKCCHVGLTVPPKMIFGSQGLTTPHLTKGSRQRLAHPQRPPAHPASPSSRPLSSLLTHRPCCPLTWLHTASLEVGRPSRQKGRRQDHQGVQVREQGSRRPHNSPSSPLPPALPPPPLQPLISPCR